MNGYIQIQLGGKLRGCKFGNRALLSVMQKHKVDEGIKFSFDLLADLVYHGLLNNCLIKKEDPDFTEAEVIEWVDDMPLDKLTEIFNSFQTSFSGDVIGKPAVTKAIKKKQVQ